MAIAGRRARRPRRFGKIASRPHLAGIERRRRYPSRAWLGRRVAAAAGPVLFEDADRLGFDDNALFHVINSVRENGTSLLITSRLWPMSWPVLLPDLRSRLKAATVVEIGEPDEALLSQVIVKLFADRQIAIEPNVISFLVSHMERSLSTANRIVERLDREALEKKSRITRALAASVVTALDEGQAAFDL